MHRAMGSLSTGTYLIIGSMNKQDHLPRVEREDTGHKLRSTKNKQDENIEWHFESLGHNLVRIRNKKSGTAYRPLAFSEGALLDQECGPTVYKVEETETKGEYV
ncbi:hypothetical protein APHAL10511_002895 [Amanita phalloides]|nr:hypothetical protein APHAL10511_002895 [Amanita phalloides]